MARSVICFGVFAVGLAIAVPAAADNQHHGKYVTVSKLLIDPGMTMMNDGPDPQQQQQAASRGAPMEQGAGVPLDEMGGQDADAPAGDDPLSDNAVETDTVYTA